MILVHEIEIGSLLTWWVLLLRELWELGRIIVILLVSLWLLIADEALNFAKDWLTDWTNHSACFCCICWSLLRQRSILCWCINALSWFNCIFCSSSSSMFDGWACSLKGSGDTSLISLHFHGLCSVHNSSCHSCFVGLLFNSTGTFA